METFGRESSEFKENIAKVPSDLLELFLRQFDSHPRALRVGKIETKEDSKKAKKRSLDEDESLDVIILEEEESY